MSGSPGNGAHQTQVTGVSTQAAAGYNFENTKPGKDESNDLISVHNSGNPVFSCPSNVKEVVQPLGEDSFEGYNAKPQHPMYMTSSMEYGNRQPTVHTMPTSFHSKCQKFTEPLGKCGMYRNHSLNTALDKSII